MASERLEGVEMGVGRGGGGCGGGASRLDSAFLRPVGDREGPSSGSGGVEEVRSWTEMCHTWVLSHWKGWRGGWGGVLFGVWRKGVCYCDWIEVKS